MKINTRLIAASLFAVAQVLPVSPVLAEPVPPAEQPMAPRVPYDAELYVLGYDVFMANGNLVEAFLLAEKAVAARPRDAAWRRRAAQSGEWSGNGASAFEHWYYLAKELKQKDAYDASMRLGRQLGEGGRLKVLMETFGISGDRQQLQEYIVLSENAGKPEDAIQALEKFRRGGEQRFVLQELSRLYELSGQNQKAIAAINESLVIFGTTSAGLLKAASLAYASGDVDSAYTILRPYMGEIKPAEHDYWKNLGDLAWALQDMPVAEKAALTLIEAQAGRDVDYQRLIMLNREQQPAVAYKLALDAWTKFGGSIMLMTLLELGANQGRHKELYPLLITLQRSGAAKSLDGDAHYWSLAAQICGGAGDNRCAISSYKRALSLDPSEQMLAAGYIWLLLDLDEKTELRATLLAWQGREKYMPDLYEPFAAAYAQLGEYGSALPLYQKRYAAKHNDPLWLAGYADTLEQSGWPDAAFTQRVKSLRMVRRKMQTADFKVETERRSMLQSHARLAMRITPGETADDQFRKIIREPQDRGSRELVAAWSLYSGRNDFGRKWFWKEFARSASRPRWVELALALEENNRPHLAQLLENDLQRLPYRDAVEASLRTGKQELAEQIIFDRSGTNSTDYLLYEQMRELYGNNASVVDYRLTLADRQGIGFADNTVLLSKKVTPRWRIMAETSNTSFGKLKSGSSGTLPGYEQRGRLGATYKLERGSVTAFGGVRSALEDFAFAGLAADYSPTNRFRLAAELQYAGRPVETAPLMIAGLKDMVVLAPSYRLTQRDTISARATVFSLRDQQRRLLSSGESLELEVAHQINFAYPDWRLRAYGGYFNFRQKGEPQGKMLSMVPAESTTYNYFMPQSFWQGGMGLSFGYNSRYVYTKQWRLFGSSDLLWNSTSRWGWNYAFGAHGPVFGFDKLSLSVYQDSGTFGKSDLNTIFEIGYTYYLN